MTVADSTYLRVVSVDALKPSSLAKDLANALVGVPPNAVVALSTDVRANSTRTATVLLDRAQLPR